MFNLIRYDELYIRDGLNNSFPNMGPTTGYKGNSPTTVVQSSGEGVFFNFLTSATTRTRGFQLWYEILGKI